MIIFRNIFYASLAVLVSFLSLTGFLDWLAALWVLPQLESNPMLTHQETQSQL